MRLLLDEMFSPRIAHALRDGGVDAQAVAERPDLRRADDAAILSAAAREQRAVVTDNVRDFKPLLDRISAEGESHHGVIFTSTRSFPRSAKGIGPIVTALRRYVREHPSDDALAGSWDWLR